MNNSFLPEIQDEPEPTPAERDELKKILRYLRDVRDRSGYGDVTIFLKAGEVEEIRAGYTIRPKALAHTAPIERNSR